MVKDWLAIRSMTNPMSALEHSSNDVYLLVSHHVPSAFGKEDKIECMWLSSSRDSLFAFFKEIVLRQMLFEDYVNGDAVPGLQNLDFDPLLSILIEGAKNGELGHWHGGLVALQEIHDWANNESEENRYEKIEAILRTHDLNLRVEYYSSLEDAKKTKGEKRELLDQFLCGNLF